MKTKIILLFFIIVLWPCSIVFAQSKIDVLHYKFEIELNDRNDSIHGIALINFVSLENTSTVSFDLANINNDKKGMTVSDVLFGNHRLGNPFFKQAHDKLIITNPNSFKKEDTILVLIYYKGIPSDGLIISKNKNGNRTFFADNWPNRAHNWIPCVDDPSDKASVEFVVTAPNHYQVTSNGMLIEETNLPGNKMLSHWNETVELPTKVMVIGVAEFAVGYAGDAAGIPVYSWVYPEEKEKGFYDYALATEILSFFIEYIGPYPYKKLANVQSKTIFGGMENASAIFYHENSVTGERKEESLLAHEIAHQWFGDMATEKSFPHLWLSEGFATYMTHIYLETKYGTDSLNKRMQQDREQIIDFAKKNQLPVVDSVSAWMSLLNANSYQKGGWVLHMLRRETGDAIFKKIIRTYYNKFKGKNADTWDFQAVAEEICRKKMETFFRQWLFQPGIPDLKINWQFVEKDKMLHLTLEQIQKEIFSFPLEIKITLTNGNKLSRTMNITKSIETFNISLTGKPSAIELDPNTSLLFKGIIAEKQN